MCNCGWVVDARVRMVDAIHKERTQVVRAEGDIWTHFDAEGSKRKHWKCVELHFGVLINQYSGNVC